MRRVMLGVAGAFYASAVLLAVAGVPKLRAPATTVRAVRAVGLPVTAVAIRALGLGEIAVGIAALAVGGRLVASLVALSYAVFTVFVALALRKGVAVRSCGCFGSDDTPATVTHLVLTALAAVAAAALALNPTPGFLTVLAGQPLAGVPFVAATVVCAWLAYLALAVLPLVQAAGRPSSRSTP